MEGGGRDWGGVVLMEWRGWWGAWGGGRGGRSSSPPLPGPRGCVFLSSAFLASSQEAFLLLHHPDTRNLSSA